MSDEPNLSTIVLISGVISTIVTGAVTTFFQRRSDEKLEKLKDELSKEAREHNARLDYQYEALKRLYNDVEPLLFSAQLAARSVHGRLRSMTERISEGHITMDPKKTWMNGGYYQQSSIYRLFILLAAHSLVSRKISNFDITIEPDIGSKYAVLSIFRNIFVAHFDLARVQDFAVDYAPYDDVSDAEKKANPSKYEFQGLVRGDVERLAAAMLVGEATNRRLLEWHEFEEGLADTNSELSAAYAPVAVIFDEFHPSTSPIVWRALIAFDILSEFYTTTSSFTKDAFDRFDDSLAFEAFDYRTEGERKTLSVNDQTVSHHYKAAFAFLQAEFEKSFINVSAAES